MSTDSYDDLIGSIENRLPKELHCPATAIVQYTLSLGEISMSRTDSLWRLTPNFAGFKVMPRRQCLMVTLAPCLPFVPKEYRPMIEAGPFSYNQIPLACTQHLLPVAHAIKVAYDFTVR